MGGNGLLRSLSEQRVLDAVLEHGPVSRAHIAKAVGLSKPTVSSVIAALEACDLVRPCGSAVGGIGRPAVLYEINRRAGFVCGVDIGGRNVRVGLTDLFGAVVDEVVEPTEVSQPLRQVSRLFHQLLHRAGVDGSLVRGGAVGVPGVYDPATGMVSASYNVALGGRDVGKWLRHALQMPLVIDNDVNLAAVGERWRGVASGCDNFVTFFVGTGVGLGIVIDGEVYAGAEGAAGEIGFLPVGVADPFDPRHQTRGPFESAASRSGLVAHVDELLAARMSSSLGPDSDLSQVFAAAAQGDDVALRSLERESRLIAMGIAAVASVLAPELVVLGGSIGADRQLVPAVRRAVGRLLPRQPRVEVSTLGERAVLYGAIAAGLGVVRTGLLEEVAATSAGSS